MLWLGIAPLNALATGKFQAVFGTLSSSINYFRKGHIDFKPLLPVIALAMLASAVGTVGVLQFSNDSLEQLLPYFLVGIALYTWFSPAISDVDQSPKLSPSRFAVVAGCGIGIYGGFFGPGIGAIAALSFSGLLGYNIRKATASAKPVVVAANATSLLIFMASGHLLLTVGICMALSQIVGAYIGSNLAISKGVAIIKPVLVVSTLAIAIKLLLDAL